ncbi:MAG: adenylyltransferase/cytidyltransferase family protein, partial [Candidatus Uhrbacteria bacterium]
FHNGHLMVIKGMAKVCNQVIVVIGSTQKSGTDENPYSVAERKEMIQQALQDEDMIPRFDIIFREVEDMKDDTAWTEAVCQACGDISVVWTGDEHTKKCFVAKGIEVKDIVPVPGISGTDIRKKIKAKDDAWRIQVPAAVVKAVLNSYK